MKPTRSCERELYVWLQIQFRIRNNAFWQRGTLPSCYFRYLNVSLRNENNNKRRDKTHHRTVFSQNTRVSHAIFTINIPNSSVYLFDTSNRYAFAFAVPYATETYLFNGFKRNFLQSKFLEGVVKSLSVCFTRVGFYKKKKKTFPNSILELQSSLNTEPT